MVKIWFVCVGQVLVRGKMEALAVAGGTTLDEY